VCAHDAADNKVTKGHGQGSIDEERSSTNLINEEKHDRGEDDKEGVLNATRNEVDVARETRHSENVHNVVCVSSQ
jgi:hypothetical protein